MAAKAPASRKTQLRPTLVKNWQVPGFDETFPQDPLTFFEKNEFFALVARMIENSLAGGAELDAVLALVGMSEENVAKIKKGNIDMSMLPPVDSVISILTRIVTASPVMLEETFLIALSIPPERRKEVLVGLRQIDDQVGFGILDTFVEQNADTLVGFFGRWRDLATKTMAMFRQNTPESSPISTD